MAELITLIICAILSVIAFRPKREETVKDYMTKKAVK